MISQIVAVVLLAVIAVAVEGASVALENDFIIGRRFGPVSHRYKDEKTGKVSVRRSYYQEFKSPSGWRPIEPICWDEFNDLKAHRLYLEQYEELEAIRVYLDPGTPETLYWIGGEWNSRLGIFQWDNGLPFGDVWNNTWDDGYPGRPTDSTKVLLSTSGTDYLFRTDGEDRLHAYVCELDDDETCILDSDLVVVLDGSGSVTAPGFELAKQFIANLADAWFANEENRISLVVFGTNVSTEFSLDNGLSPSDIKEKINSTEYPGGGTFTHLGLEVALGELSKHNRTSPQNVVLLTDGQSSDNAQTLEIAKKLRDAGVEIFAVGVGSIDYDELLGVVGNNTEHVFTTDGFEGLVDVLEILKEGLC